MSKPLERYSHRNGETEPPTEAGWYWMRGERKLYGQKIKIRHLLHIVWLGGDRFEVQFGNSSWPIGIYTGQWWGPVRPPWEQSATVPGAMPVADDVRKAIYFLCNTSCYTGGANSPMRRDAMKYARTARAWLAAQPSAQDAAG